jgi:hypothetical protein
MKKVINFIDEWGFRIIFPLVIIMFLKTCTTNNNIEKSELKLRQDIVKIDSLLKKINQDYVTEEKMIDLIKNTPNWKTLELEELSDKNRIPINKLKNDEE